MGQASRANCSPSAVKVIPSGPVRSNVVPVASSSWRIWLSRVARMMPISRAA
jgi:hypothetical protein